MRPLLLLALAACTNPFIPEGTARIDPPAAYRQWWEASRACIDRPEFRAFEDIEWYWSPDLLKGSDGEDALGLTIENRVYLYVAVAQTPWVIQHELVHAINRLGAHPHPYDPFVTCGLMPTTSASVLHFVTREDTCLTPRSSKPWMPTSKRSMTLDTRVGLRPEVLRQ